MKYCNWLKGTQVIRLELFLCWHNQKDETRKAGPVKLQLVFNSSHADKDEVSVGTIALFQVLCEAAK